MLAGSYLNSLDRQFIFHFYCDKVKLFFTAILVFYVRFFGVCLRVCC